MKRLALALALLLAPGAAWAGCWNFYEVDPYALPEVDLCIQDECNRTSILRTCANVHSGFTFFTNGWSTHFSAERKEPWVVISADGTQIPEKDFTCRPVGEGVEGCY
jgi:hypothetical protein